MCLPLLFCLLISSRPSFGQGGDGWGQLTDVSVSRDNPAAFENPVTSPMAAVPVASVAVASVAVASVTGASSRGGVWQCKVESPPRGAGDGLGHCTSRRWQCTSAVLLWHLLSAPTAAAASALPLDGSHTDASANLEWLQVGTWFPAQFWNTAGSYGVLMCKYNKAAIARNVAMRAFDQPNVTAENCRSAEFEALKTLVDERLSDSCPVPETAFIHHVPHAGSTLLASMLESIDAVRTWSEYPFASKLSEYAETADKSDQQKVSPSPQALRPRSGLDTSLSTLLPASGETKVEPQRLFFPLPWLHQSLSPSFHLSLDVHLHILTTPLAAQVKCMVIKLDCRTSPARMEPIRACRQGLSSASLAAHTPYKASRQSINLLSPHRPPPPIARLSLLLACKALFLLTYLSRSPLCAHIPFLVDLLLSALCSTLLACSPLCTPAQTLSPRK